ncbi:hypothetical protein ACLOJK_041530 [Asimina triloba]
MEAVHHRHPLRASVPLLLLRPRRQSCVLFVRPPRGRRSSPILVAVSAFQPHNSIASDDESGRGKEKQQQLIFRRHNSKSAALLLFGLQQEVDQNDDQTPQTQISLGRTSHNLFLVGSERRSPQFPGAIDFCNSVHVRSGVGDDGTTDAGDQKMLMRALQLRRSATADILKQLMRGAKIGPTYSSNLVSRLPDFIDHVLVTSAAMKQLPEFSHSPFDARAKTIIQNSDLIPIVRWLKHNSLTYPQIGRLVCMTSRNLEPIRVLVNWLKSIYVKSEYLGRVLTKANGILERSPDELEQLVVCLESNGVKREWMGFVVSRCPQLLSFSMDDIKSHVNFYLEMGLNTKDFGTMVFDYPKALGFFSLEEMKRKVQYLKEFGLTSEDVGRLLAFKPQLMGCSIEEKWKPLVKYLYYLGVHRDGMRKILTVKPMIFCVDLDKTIVPKVCFFRDIGIQDEAIGGVLVIFLMTKAGVSKRDIGKVLALEPELLGCSITDKLETNVKYFLSLGISLQCLGEMIADFPMLLRYNADVLRPKYRYLRRTMIRPLQDLIEFPRFFSYSLDRRIIPRYKILVEKRINFKLRYMLTGSDEDFSMRVEAAMERRKKFEAGRVDE